jgi:hypothetical protein
MEDYRFKADEWQDLTPAQRVRRCRLMAEEAQELAKNAPTNVAEAYLRIADEWLTLAVEIEQAGGSQGS